MSDRDKEFLVKYLESNFESIHQAIGAIHGRIDKQDDKIEKCNNKVSVNSKYINIAIGGILTFEFITNILGKLW